jgi:methionyl-tRNA formyltransferase
VADRGAPVADLLIGSDVGAWALDQVSPALVGTVISEERTLLHQASARGFRTRPGPVASIAVSMHYGRILSGDELRAYRRCFNLHPGFLPWGRGFYPVFWALWEGEPAGATVHEMTLGVDRGPVVLQERVRKRPNDTGGSLLRRVRAAERRLFEALWESILSAADLPGRPQGSGGSYHSKASFFALRDRAEIERYAPRDLARLIRAMTCPPYPGLSIAGTRVVAADPSAEVDL